MWVRDERERGVGERRGEADRQTFRQTGTYTNKQASGHRESV